MFLQDLVFGLFLYSFPNNNFEFSIEQKSINYGFLLKVIFSIVLKNPPFPIKSQFLFQELFFATNPKQHYAISLLEK